MAKPGRWVAKSGIWVAYQGDGGQTRRVSNDDRWLGTEMVAKQGDGWLSQGDGWLRMEMGG